MGLRTWILIALGAALLPCAGTASPESPLRVWLNPGFFSYHFDRSLDFRENNVGFGAEVLFAPDHGFVAGTFLNSHKERSNYGAYQWRPLHWRRGGVDVSAGVAIGAIDGYPKMRDGGWFLGVLPVLAVEGERFGVNFSIVPTINDRLNGAFVLQFKLRVW